MKSFFLGSIFISVLFFIIYSTLKTKKIYDEKVEYEPKNEELHKKIERLLELKKFKFQGIYKYEYNYFFNGIKQRKNLPRVKIFRKYSKKYALIINNENIKFDNNEKLKKYFFQFRITKLNGIIIFNEKDFSIEVINFYDEKKVKFILIVLIIAFLIIGTIGFWGV